MSEIKRTGFKLPHPGPYVAMITNYADTTYMGCYEAVLEQGIGTDEKLKGRTVLIHYAPPFYGVTSAKFEGNNPASFDDVQKSYGMWMTPPDLYTHVLCMFVESDSNQGYWIGCVPDRWQNHMVPGIASSSNVAWAPGQKEKYGNMPVPVAEFLKKSKENTTFKPNNEPKPVHPFADRLLKQGLLSDKYRGPTTSSARREIPSQVFGISTPGPLDPKGPKGKVGYKTKEVDARISRTGGHTFVMDDGDVYGENRLVRIRSSMGHQVLLNDTANILYISNAEGTAWLEMTAQGKIDIYAQDSISIHSEQDFNFRADRDINFEAMRNINIKSLRDTVFNIGHDYHLVVANDGKVQINGKHEHFTRSDSNISAGNELNLYASAGAANITGGGGINLASTVIKTSPGIKQNDGSTKQATFATGAMTGAVRLPTFPLPSTSVANGWSGRYQGGTISSIMQRVPMHEPWTQHESYDPNKYTANSTDVDCANTSASGNTNAAGNSSAANAPEKPLNPATPADWTKDDDWLTAVQALSGKLNCDFYDLLAVMYLETSRTMSPNKKNPKSSATGLIQFLEATAKNLGTTTGQLAGMTRVQQQVYVEKYFLQSGLKSVKSPTLGDVYMAVFAPKGIGKADSFPLYTLANNPSEYSLNSIFDKPPYGNQDGIITKAEATAPLAVFKSEVKKKLGV
jgi:hypothetical protein